MSNKLLLLFSSFILHFSLVAQTNFSLSALGVGERVESTIPVFSGMGNQSVSYAYPSILNSENPATYSFLRPQFPIFSLGFSSRLSYNELNGSTEFNSLNNISDISFGVPFAKRFGFAFGLKPKYRKNYNFIEKEPLMGDSILYEYEGSGTLNNFFIGFSAKILNFDSLKWSVGGNIGALFGSMKDVRRSSLINDLNKAGGAELKFQYVKSFYYELGTYLTYIIKGGNQISIGATFEPLQKIKSKFNRQLAYSSTDVDNPNTFELLSETGEMNGKIIFAPSYNVGLSYAKLFKIKKKNGNYRTSQLMISGGFHQTNWSNYQENYDDTTFSYNYKNSNGFQAGIQFIPETRYVGSAVPKFFERINYRLGYYNSTLPYVTGQSQWKQWGATVGFGIPVLISKRLDSSIQLGAGFGKRTSGVPGVANETFVNVNIGLLIAPSISDRWFIKRKLD